MTSAPARPTPSRAGPIAVLTNHVAGRGRHRRQLPAVLERLADRSGRPLQRLVADTAATAEAACHAAVGHGAAALVAVGGDGTLHAALQAVAGTGVPFGVVPLGTGNDLAAGFGLPRDPLAAADALAAALREDAAPGEGAAPHQPATLPAALREGAGQEAGRPADGAGHGITTRTVDLARVERPDGSVRWFGGVLAAGFDAIVNERANRMRWPRGDRRYDLAIFLELVRLRPRAYVMHLDGEEHRLDGVLVAVGNIASYGGGIRICPGADPTDGLLDVVVGGPMSRLTLTRLRPHAYRGTHLRHPLVSSYRAREVRLACDPAPDTIITYADGERCSPLPATITAVPGALHVLST